MNSFILLFLTIVISAWARTVFSDIINNISQKQINQWSKNIYKALDQFFVFYFNLFLPWIEVISISIACFFCIWITAYTYPWNFDLFIFSVFVTLFCSACAIVFLNQQKIGEYLTRQVIRMIEK